MEGYPRVGRRPNEGAREMTSWTDEYMQLVDDCEKRESRLTDWDRGFLDSIKGRLEREQALTPSQIETLESIWERATAKG